MATSAGVVYAGADGRGLLARAVDDPDAPLLAASKSCEEAAAALDQQLRTRSDSVGLDCI